ncbi:hypothetical protein H0H87_005909 [Tephrocybe sp. NHM501043]|nr:hypothetical protein H0H87_005909 [Tephrocybe sp. NHM501043]
MPFKPTSRDRNTSDEAESSQPLLGNAGNIHNQTIFSIDDDDDDQGEGTILTAKTDHAVRFREEPQIIGPPLRSTLASREAEYELDSDELDEADDVETIPQRSQSDQSMPLLVGLFDSARRSTDAPNSHEMSGGPDYDLEELAAKATAGGGLFDSIANMANSILGAGEVLCAPSRVSRAHIL